MKRCFGVVVGVVSVFFTAQLGWAQLELPLRGESGETILGLGTLREATMSPDGKYIATCGSIGAFLWDAETGELWQAFLGHEGGVNCVAFSPDGTQVLTGSNDATAKLWDTETGENVWTYSTHYWFSVKCLAFSPDGTKVVTGSGGTVTILDAETGDEIRMFSAHELWVNCVVFSPDGTRILSGGYEQTGSEGTAKLWDTKTGERIRTFVELSMVNSVAFSPDGAKVVTGTWNVAHLWDTETGRRIQAFSKRMTYDDVKAVTFSPDGTKVLTGGGANNTTAELWDLATGDKIRTFVGHTDDVNSVAFSPDGTRILTGSADQTAKVWDVETGEQIRTFTMHLSGHTAAVHSVSFSPDAARILTGSGDDTAKLWDAETGDELRTFVGHTQDVNSVAFSPDDTRILTGSDDQTAKLWEGETGQEINTFSSHTAEIYSVAFSPKGTEVLTGAGDNTAKLWDAETGEEIRTFSGHTDSVQSVAFSPDGSKVFTGSGDETAKLWDTVTGAVLVTFAGHESGRITSVAFSPDGTKVLTGSNDETAKLWDAETGEEIRTFSGHSYPVTFVAFSPDEITVLTGSTDDTAKLWDAETGEEIWTFSGHTSGVNCVAFSPDGTRVITGGRDNTGRIWSISAVHTPTNTPTPTPTPTPHWDQLELPLRGESGEIILGLGTLEDAAYSPDGRYIATCGSIGAFLWDAETGELMQAFFGHTERVNSVAFSPDGRQVLTGSNDDTAKLWDAGTGQEIRTFSRQKFGVRSVAFSPDGTKVVTGGHDYASLSDTLTGDRIHSFYYYGIGGGYSVAFSPDGTKVLTGDYDKATLWDTDSGERIRSFYSNTTGHTRAAFSPDGTRILTVGSYERAARLWDTETGEEIRAFPGHRDYLTSVVFSPDGTKILTGSEDKTAKLWDAENGAQIRTFSGHVGSVESVAFSPDGTTILTGSVDDIARLWNVEAGDEIRMFSMHASGHTDNVNSVLCSPDGTRVLTASSDGTGRLWDAETGQVIRSFFGHTDSVYFAVFLQNGARILTGSSDKTAKLWDAHTGDELQTYSEHTGWILSATFSTDGIKVLTGNEDNTVKLWDIETGMQIQTFIGHTECVYSAAFSPDGKKVVTGAEHPDCSVKLWDIKTGDLIWTFSGHTSGVDSVAFSPDGTKVVTGSWRKSKLWDTETGEELRTFVGHAKDVNSVVFSWDGTKVLTGSSDRTAKLWDAETGEEIRTFPGHTSSVNCVAFSPDGMKILTGSNDGTARIWPLSNEPTPAATNTPTLRLTATFTPTNTLTPRPIATNTPTNTPIPTDIPTFTPRPTDTPTFTRRPTNTPTKTATFTHTPTDTPMPEDTPTFTHTATDTPTLTPTPTDTPTTTAPTISFSITVLDSQSIEPVPNVLLIIEELSILERTNDQGIVLLTDIPVGTIHITLTKTGYETTETDIEVTADLLNKNLLLHPLGAGPTATPTSEIVPTPTSIPTPGKGNLTLAVVSQSRLEKFYGEERAAVFLEKLRQLLSHESVRGEIVDLDVNASLRQWYQEWDRSTDGLPTATSSSREDNVLKANMVATAIKTVLGNRREHVRNEAVKYIILVGSDRIIPHYRLPDMARPKNRESQHDINALDLTLPPDAAIHENYLLIDDYYADATPKTYQIMDREFYLPDFEIGRLATTPEEMGAHIDTYLALDGKIYFEKAFIAGSDVFSNGADRTRDIAEADLGEAERLPEDGVDPIEIADGLNKGNTINVLGLHGDRSLIYRKGNESPLTSKRLDQFVQPEKVRGSVVVNFASHGGLSKEVEDESDEKDLVRVFASKGVGAYIGTTARSGASNSSIAFTEDLASRFVHSLVSGKEAETVGGALREAKREYVINEHNGIRNSNLSDEEIRQNIGEDEKTVAGTTLYGLPMYTVTSSNSPGDPHLAMGYGQSSTPSVSPPILDDSVKNQRNESQPPPNLPRSSGEEKKQTHLRCFLPQSLGEIQRGLSYDPGQKILWAEPNAVGEGLLRSQRIELIDKQFLEKHETESGIFYAFNGITQANVNEPVQPRAGYITGTEGFFPKGAVLEYAKYEVIEAFDPVIEGSQWGAGEAQEGTFEKQGFFPAIPFTVNTIAAQGGLPPLQRFVFVAGQYNDQTKQERLYEELRYSTYYTASESGETPPTVSDPSVMVQGERVLVSVEAEDVDGDPLYRVVVLWTDGNGEWNAVDLEQSSANPLIWEGELTRVAGLEFFVQAIDMLGNVAYADNRGRYYKPLEGGEELTPTPVPENVLAQIKFSEASVEEAGFVYSPATGFDVASISVGDVPAGLGTDGRGLIIEAQPGQGTLAISTVPVSANSGAVMLSVNVRADGEGCSAALAALNSPIDGQLGYSNASGADVPVGEWGKFILFYSPPAHALQPGLQVALPESAAGPVEVYFDDLIISELPEYEFEDVTLDIDGSFDGDTSGILKNVNGDTGSFVMLPDPAGGRNSLLSILPSDDAANIGVFAGALQGGFPHVLRASVDAELFAGTGGVTALVMTNGYGNVGVFVNNSELADQQRISVGGIFFTENSTFPVLCVVQNGGPGVESSVAVDNLKVERFR